MRLNILAFAIPLFVTFILLEYFIARKKKLDYFHLENSFANISIGIAERLLDVFTTGIFFFVYDFLHRHFAIFKISPSILLWVLLLICTDFVWYWYHRLAHEINLFWAVHVVHHQSDDFNYTVSARITVFQAIVRTGFWSILPILGFPPAMITSMLLVHGLYPFFIHTRLIGNLGILEYILVTPSHHRVHHASNEEYLDKNYGDVFIIWDKLFGTFKKEEPGKAIAYGLTKPLNSYSFLWQHFHFIIEIYIAVRKADSWKEKLKIIFGKPDHIDPTIRDTAEKIFLSNKRRMPQEEKLNRYVIWQLGITLITLFVFILFEKNIDGFLQLTFALIVLITLTNCGAIMEQKKWIVYLEYARLCITVIAITYLYPNVWVFFIALWAVVLLVSYFKSLQTHYLQLVYRSY